MKKNYSISEVSELLGISSQMIRKYEQEGLVSTTRKENNYRHFESPDITMLMRIRLYRNLGFSLDEIRCLTAIENGDGDELFRQRIEQLDKQIERLQMLRRCAELHRSYLSSCPEQDKIKIEMSPPLRAVFYRHGREIDDAYRGNDLISRMLDYSPPFQYILRMNKSTYRYDSTGYEVGLAMPAEFAGSVPDFPNIEIIEPRICVSVLLNHQVHRIDGRWEIISLSDDFEQAGVYDFLYENALSLKADIIGLKYDDRYDGESFLHSFRYYLPVF